MDDKNIQAEILEHTINEEFPSNDLITFRLKLPTIILAELNTHRAFSRNSSSLRAIPFNKIVDRVRNEPFIPSVWTTNKPGMQGDIVTDEDIIEEMRCAWCEAAISAAEVAENMFNTGVHKQVVNRILMPYLYTDTVLTSTEWDNFYELRLHEAAEPHIRQLAQKMADAVNHSEGKEQFTHIPYSDDLNDSDMTVNEMMMVSAARCARVSYTLFDGTTSIEKDMELAIKLRDSKHMSPFEHQAFCLHYTVASNGESRNFHKRFIQFRSLVESISDYDA